MLIINDVHIGVARKGGTTPASQEALRGFLFAGLRKLLEGSDEDTLVTLGDLFDDFSIPMRDWVETFQVLTEWLDKGHHLVLVAGNHDNSPRADKVSSFTALGAVLKESYKHSVKVIDVGQSGWVDNDTLAIAHCANQDLFNLEIAKALKACPRNLLVHCNYANGFAAESDHSLNLSMEQAAELANNGTRVIFAHEHQAREDLNGKVVVLGNQHPTSVSDCLGNSHKYAHILGDEDHGSDGALTKVETWREDGSFVLADWQDLADVDGQFVRVTGTATAAQASDVVNAIAAFRQRSDAFVITNAVRVEGIAEIDELPEQFEVAKAFDVLNFICDQLDPSEVETVNSLLKD